MGDKLIEIALQGVVFGVLSGGAFIIMVKSSLRIIEYRLTVHDKALDRLPCMRPACAPSIVDGA